MSSAVKSPRSYDSSTRRAQAAETRRQVLAAATELFLERGYAATTMSDVSAAAGVAVQTVYSSVGGKADLLKQAVDVAVVGDDAPVPMMDRPDIRAIAAEPDGRRKLEMFAAHLARVQGRTARLMRVLQVAVDSDEAVEDLRRTLLAQRRQGMRAFAGDLRRRRLLRPGVTAERAADILVGHMDAAHYLTFREDLGWADRDYRRWYVTVTAAAILREPAGQ
jgi:TetR/AcrR family transcriptional regulator, regulator of autoinduction and epiphytic fitness